MSKKEHVALTRCFYCCEPDRILLATHYDQKGEPIRDLGPAHNKVVDMEPCPQCREYMEQGIILIGIDEKKSDPGWQKEKLPNPWRSGAFSVIKEEAFDRVFPEEFHEFAHKHRWMFIEHAAMVNLGIVKEEQDGEGNS
jgi:hypothetical protein